MNAKLRMLQGDAGYWYMATPYSNYPDGLDAAFSAACRAASKLIDDGVRVFSPIAHTHPIAIHGQMDPLDHDVWLPADQPFMTGACGLLVIKMKTWRDSYGVGVEIKEFEADGKPVFYLEEAP